ncbi:hypothetical protein P43SY_001294 [Pythium insidiosum]|uniref:PPM-type phosphatase domain-containing protein n=1 Tax=Pythium insidiosum TaxID=114742 RepID=A0AAD5QB56_PYTIN|nr:hypothetical protein P43SY_001294 [Pythium insidiosum]
MTMMMSTNHCRFLSSLEVRPFVAAVQNKRLPPPLLEDDFPFPRRTGHYMAEWYRKWILSLLGLTAFGCSAALATTCRSDDAHNEGRPASPADAPASGAMEVKLNTVAATHADDRLERALSRRRSCGRGRLLVSTAAVRGDRSHMEDTSFVSSCKRFNAVFDGHGGAAVADYLKTQLFPLIGPGLVRLDTEDEQLYRKDVTQAAVETLLREAVEKVDADVVARPQWKFQGSTAVGVLLYDDSVFSMNVGDSRAVLSRGGQVVELTRDHKPNDPSERQRIEALGGTVRWYGYVDAQGVPIEPYGAYRVNGNLAVARAIGDSDLRPFVCGDVEIKRFERDFDKDEFIVIASDGLWDVFTSEEAVTFVHDVLRGELGGRESWRSGGHSDTSVPIFEWSHQYKSDRGMIKAARARRKMQIANYLVQEALFRGTSDNVSVIVVWLK